MENRAPAGIGARCERVGLRHHRAHQGLIRELAARQTSENESFSSEVK